MLVWSDELKQDIEIIVTYFKPARVAPNADKSNYRLYSDPGDPGEIEFEAYLLNDVCDIEKQLDAHDLSDSEWENIKEKIIAEIERKHGYDTLFQVIQ